MFTGRTPSPDSTALCCLPFIATDSILRLDMFRCDDHEPAFSFHKLMLSPTRGNIGTYFVIDFTCRQSLGYILGRIWGHLWKKGVNLTLDMFMGHWNDCDDQIQRRCFRSSAATPRRCWANGVSQSSGVWSQLAKTLDILSADRLYTFQSNLPLPMRMPRAFPTFLAMESSSIFKPYLNMTK